MNNHQYGVFEVLARSKLYQEFKTAFQDATGIDISFEPAQTCISPRLNGSGLHFQPQPLNFVSSGAAKPVPELLIIDWSSDFYEAVVSVHVGEQVFGLLRTGCVRNEKRKESRTGKNSAALNSSGGTPVVSKRRLIAISKMLLIFAEYLAHVSNQLMLQQSSCEPAIISRAKHYIQEHHRENMLLDDVAQHAHVSSFYLCKLFKKVTGLNFSDFLVRTRLETAKELLQDRNRRINEVALDAGFQSLTNFNRAFKQVLGQSPRDFRKETTL